MHIDIHFRDLDVSPALREYAQRRARFVLARVGDRIGRVNISMGDINGPRGGLDKRCVIQINLQQPGVVVVEDVGSDLYPLLDRCLARASRSVARRLERQTQQRYPSRRVVFVAQPDAGN